MKYWKHIFKDKPELKTLPIKVEQQPGIKYEPMFADTETSHKTEKIKQGKKETEQVSDTWVYLWMCSVGDYLYYGRYLHEFIELLEWLVKYYDLNALSQIDIYFHNASYDISYMYDLLFKFNGGTDGIKMIFIEAQRLISWKMEKFGITIKCTYRLTNRSLAKWCEDLKVEHKKQTGLKDYNAVYYPWDKLPSDEYKYGAYDIISMKECYYKELDAQGYTFATVPLTQTGFPRKEVQNEFTDKKNYFKNKKEFDKCRLNIKQYERLLKASSGGYTAGNCFTLGTKQECEQGIGHVDFKSHYPSKMRTMPYPMSPKTIKELGDTKHKMTTGELDFYVKKGYYYVVDVILQNVTLKSGVTDPSIMESKCEYNAAKTQIKKINGKVTKIIGRARLCLTNFDLDVIRWQYDIEKIAILACDIYTTKMLPDYITKVIDRYFVLKSELKNQIEELKDEYEKNPSEELQAKIDDLEVTLMIGKQKLNGIFGCCATKLIRQEIVIDTDFKFGNAETDKTPEELLEEYYNHFNSCFHFQWGVFTTSMGRYELHEVLRDVTGYEAYNYSDTDSAFYNSNPEIEQRLLEYRKKCREDSEKHGYYVTLSDGTKEYYHDLTPEKDHLKSKTFKALHAKCYALEPGGKLSCTIAGVSKRNTSGDITREEELGSIDDLAVGKEFIECGGTRADYSTMREYEGYTGGGCCILNTTKKIRPTIIDVTDDLRSV